MAIVAFASQNEGMNGRMATELAKLNIVNDRIANGLAKSE